MRLSPSLIALALGVVSATGFAPLDLWPLTIIALAGLLWLLMRAPRLRSALGLGWMFGLGQFVLGLNWIAVSFTYQAAMPAWLGWIAVVLLSLYLAVYPAIASGLAWRYGRADPLRMALLFAASWMLGEYLRAVIFTGFAWNPIGVAWVPLLPVARAAAWVGTYGLSGLMILAAGALWLLALRRWRGAALLAAPVAAAAVAGMIVQAPVPGPRAPLVRIVQPNIGQEDKWREDAAGGNFARLARITGRPGPAPRLILWPEAAVPDFLEEEPWARAKLARLLGPRDLLLTGGVALVWSNQGRAVAARNSLFVVDPQARLRGRYDKAHLVPYGEYLPMRPILSAIGLSRLAPGDLDFLPGPGPGTLTLPGFGRAGIQICYEMIFSGHVVDAKNRPDFLFNPSNDAWFGPFGPPQHLAQARLRAIEEGLPTLRSTPTGISAIIDARGGLVASLPWRTPGAIDGRMPPALGPTLFARWGNLMPLLFGGLLVLLAIAAPQKRR